MIDVNYWKNRTLTWADCKNLTWGEVIAVENVFVEIDSGKTGSGTGYINIPTKTIKDKINRLPQETTKKLITVIVKLQEKKFKQTKPVKKVEVTIEDIQFLIKETKGIEVRVLKD